MKMLKIRSEYSISVCDSLLSVIHECRHSGFTTEFGRVVNAQNASKELAEYGSLKVYEYDADELTEARKYGRPSDVEWTCQYLRYSGAKYLLIAEDYSVTECLSVSELFAYICDNSFYLENGKIPTEAQLTQLDTDCRLYRMDSDEIEDAMSRGFVMRDWDLKLLVIN